MSTGLLSGKYYPLEKRKHVFNVAVIHSKNFLSTYLYSIYMPVFLYYSGANSYQTFPHAMFYIILFNLHNNSVKWILFLPILQMETFTEVTNPISGRANFWNQVFWSRVRALNHDGVLSLHEDESKDK